MDERPGSGLDPKRFAQGMTYEQYLAYIGTPENLAREAGWWKGTVRHDFGGLLRAWASQRRLSAEQAQAIRWLAAQRGGPAKILVISEEWSSDCRRDVPMLALLAAAGGLELRIFTRDGDTLGRGPRSDPAESPNADLVNQHLNEKDGETYQSVPVAAFYTRDDELLYRYIEFPALYPKMRLAALLQRPRAGESSKEETWERFLHDWGAVQQGPFFAMWAAATVDEILTELYLRVVAGGAHE